MPEITARRCIFCGSTELDEEHVWPQWVARLLPDDLDVTTTRTQSDVHTGSTAAIGPAWGGPPLDMTVRRTCKTCNSGWMSDLENAAKPHLTPLIFGQQTFLDADAQRIAATWALVRVFVAEFTHPREIAVPAIHRQWVYERRAPPTAGIYVWLAGYAGQRWAGYYRHHPLSAFEGTKRPDGPEHVNGYGVTFGVYKLIFQVFGSTVAPLGGDMQQGGALGHSTYRIWPAASPCLLPVGVPLGDETLEMFADVFRRSAQ